MVATIVHPCRATWLIYILWSESWRLRLFNWRRVASNLEGCQSAFGNQGEQLLRRSCSLFALRRRKITAVIQNMDVDTIQKAVNEDRDPDKNNDFVKVGYSDVICEPTAIAIPERLHQFIKTIYGSTVSHTGCWPSCSAAFCPLSMDYSLES